MLKKTVLDELPPLQPGESEYTRIFKFLRMKENEALEQVKKKYAELYEKEDRLMPKSTLSK